MNTQPETVTPAEPSETEEQVMEVGEGKMDGMEKKSPMGIFTFIVLFILWSLLMVYMGGYLSTHPFSK